MLLWRYRVISLFRTLYNNGEIILPESIKRNFNNTYSLLDLLSELFSKSWIVHCSIPQSSYYHNLNYLGRYVKRPPIADSRLSHYYGNSVTFSYLDRKSKAYHNFSLSLFEFIGKFISHIHDQNFRVIRYHGILANRVRGEQLILITLNKLT